MQQLVQATIAILLASTIALNIPSDPAPAASTLPAFSHIFTIVLENKEFDSVVGKAKAPYFNQLAQTYGLATQSYGQRHPSLPNYLALTSGSTHGISSDCTSCFVDAPNIVDQLEAAGHSWKAYMESMPSPCFVGDKGTLYRQKHNPFIYYDNIRNNPTRCANVVPFTEFSSDVQSGTLADYVWITPNMCNDAHDCSISVSDRWLKLWVPQILASPAWQQNGLLIITFDEGKGATGCCTDAVGGRIPTLVISPLGKPAYQSAIPYDQYSVLRTVEEAWGMPLLANAASERSPSLSDFFVEQPGAPTATDTAIVPTSTNTAVVLTATPTPHVTPTSTPLYPSSRRFQLNLPFIHR